jgi:phosphoribosylformylglycinamidine synthase
MSASPGTLILPGSTAHSPFRIQQVLERLRAVDARVEAVTARYVHLARVTRPLSGTERATLEALLTYGPRDHAPAADDGGTLIVVAPRPGTISPWSSKATDIARVCGLSALERVERGIAYTLSAAGTLDGAALERLAAALHDRMTEAPLFDRDETSRLFAHDAPRPMTSVDVLGGGRAALVRANATSAWRCRRTRSTTSWSAYRRSAATRPTSS